MPKTVYGSSRENGASLKSVLPVWTGCARMLLLLLFVQLVFVSAASAGENKKTAINCDIQNGACTQSLGSRNVTLEILPRPVKAMHELTFIVSVEGNTVTMPPYIKLNMPAMDMGKNIVKLIHTNSGTYEGSGVIVRCRSGRRTWKATVEFPELGAVDYIFDVIY